MVVPTSSSGSLFVITPLSGQTAPELAPYSARGLKQTYKQIGRGEATVRETVDGRTIDLTPRWMKKYESVVTCTDVSLPYIDGAFRGLVCSVQWACELPYFGSPDRPAVVDSERVDPISHVAFYRPQINMVVLDIEVTEHDEWKATYAWRILLREQQAP